MFMIIYKYANKFFHRNYVWEHTTLDFIVRDHHNKENGSQKTERISKKNDKQS